MNRTFDLVLSADMLPRTTTRQRWREIDHWRRATRRKMAQIMDEQIRNMALVPLIYRADMLDKMINPPIFAWPSA